MIRTAVDVVGLLSFGIKTAGRPDRERHWSVDGAAGKVPPGSRSWPQQLLDTAQDWRRIERQLLCVWQRLLWQEALAEFLVSFQCLSPFHFIPPRPSCLYCLDRFIHFPFRLLFFFAKITQNPDSMLEIFEIGANLNGFSLLVELVRELNKWVL